MRKQITEEYHKGYARGFKKGKGTGVFQGFALALIVYAVATGFAIYHFGEVIVNACSNLSR